MKTIEANKNGTWLGEESIFPYLQPLPDAINFLAVNRINHFAKNCGYYNNLFSIVITGVDNGPRRYWL